MSTLRAPLRKYLHRLLCNICWEHVCNSFSLWKTERLMTGELGYKRHAFQTMPSSMVKSFVSLNVSKNIQFMHHVNHKYSNQQLSMNIVMYELSNAKCLYLSKWCRTFGAIGILMHMHVGSKFAALIIVRRIWIIVGNWKVYLNWFCLYWIEPMCVRQGPAVMALCPGIESRALGPGCNVLIARPYPTWQTRSSNNVQLRLREIYGSLHQCNSL